jgi:hypothetical protein
MLVFSLANTCTSACRIDGSAQSGAPEDLAALERVAETIAAGVVIADEASRAETEVLETGGSGTWVERY